jgi:hypothetical protein
VQAVLSFRAIALSQALLDPMPSPARAAEKLEQALEMYEEGVSLQRQNFLRRQPGLTEVELEAMMLSWILREGPK